MEAFVCVQVSLCAEPLTELSNPGASGSIFYCTHDDEFIIKTVQHKEADFLQKLLPGYFLVSCCLFQTASKLSLQDLLNKNSYRISSTDRQSGEYCTCQATGKLVSEHGSSLTQCKIIKQSPKVPCDLHCADSGLVTVSKKNI